MGKFGILAALLVLSATSAMAQDNPPSAAPPATPTPAWHDDTSLQVGIGATYVRFYEAPGIVGNGYGGQVDAVYYHDWIGTEGQFSYVYGSTSGGTSYPLFAGAGIRVRWQNSSPIELWGHGLVGFNRLEPAPTSTLGGSNGVGFKAGGGVDIRPHHSRIGFRISGDLYGSGFFGTSQISPEVSAGVVLYLGHNRTHWSN